MACTRPVLALSHLTALALAGCSITNPGFLFEPESTGADTATTTGTSSEPGTDASPTSTAAQPDTTTAQPDTTSTGPTGDTTGSDATSVGETSPDGTSGVNVCDVLLSMDIMAVSDAFFIAGSTDGGTKCNYYDALLGGATGPCHALNFGTTGALQLARTAEFEGMYAVRFDQSPLALLDQDQVHIDHAELLMTGYGFIQQELTLQVGAITEPWSEGNKNGTLAEQGDSTYAEPTLGIIESAWTNGDGPRGASQPLASLSVPIPPQDQDHFTLTSEPFALAPGFSDQLSLNGLVVAYPAGMLVKSFGPGLKSRESGVFQPILRVYYCNP